MARQRKLSPERKAFISGLLEHYQPQDAQDVQDMLKDLLGDTLQEMLEAEMDQKLGYSKYDYQNKDTDDSRNGYSKKTVVSSMGEIDLDIPRDISTHLHDVYNELAGQPLGRYYSGNTGYRGWHFAPIT